MYFIIGLIVGFILGYTVSNIVHELKPQHIVFERDERGRITAIHYVAKR